MEQNDAKILDEEDLAKPERPKEINEEEVYNEMLKNYQRSRKAPGEPFLSFDLVEESGSITPTAQCSKYDRLPNPHESIQNR